MILIILMTLINLNSHAGKRVKTFQNCAMKSLSYTHALQSYLTMLLEKGLIDQNLLQAWIEDLKKGSWVNPIPEEVIQSNPALFIHRQGLDEDYFSNPKIMVALDLEAMLKWGQEVLRREEQVKQKRKEASQETISPFRKMKFNRVPKGKFKFQNETEVEIENDFYMMDTHVTQYQWVELMGKNPSQQTALMVSHPQSFQADPGGFPIHVELNGRRVLIRPEHPVESVTWWSALEFANRLSIAHGLKPVYDLTAIEFMDGSNAEEGTLGMQNYTVDDEKVSVLLKVLTDSGLPQDGEGYRLPTEAEMEYVMTDLGQSQSKYIFGDSQETLKEYAWFKENTGGVIRAVAQKKPLVVAGGKFYDLYGNVESWCWDSYAYSITRRKYRRVRRGGGNFMDAKKLESRYRSGDYPSSSSFNASFRLVRTIK